METAAVSGKAIFVKLNEYKEILSLMTDLKDKLDVAKQTLDKIQGLKTEEETELELWNTSIKEIENKIEFIDKRLMEPDSNA